MPVLIIASHLLAGNGLCVDAIVSAGRIEAQLLAAARYNGNLRFTFVYILALFALLVEFVAVGARRRRMWAGGVDDVETLVAARRVRAHLRLQIAQNVRSLALVDVVALAGALVEQKAARTIPDRPKCDAEIQSK